MNNLSNTIYSYYVQHFNDLSPDKQFHFASRLYLWNGDVFCHRKLQDLRPWYTCNEQPLTALQEVMLTVTKSPVYGSKNVSALRAPYIKKYPWLGDYNTALYRITFFETIYDIEAGPLFFALFPRQKVASMASQLLQDAQAMATLSTHAINFLYLYAGIGGNKIDAQLLFNIGRTGYDLANPLHLQLLTYLYTHCIIGASRFYSQHTPHAERQIYLSMLEYLEELIDTNFEHINLDNKFEFLVCAKLLGQTSNLAERIAAEAENSVSNNGSFLVDRHNLNPQTNNTSLNKSEHRNVLFIMASRDFMPQSTPS